MKGHATTEGEAESRKLTSVKKKVSNMKQMVKSMDRQFTDDEGKKILDYWKENKSMSLDGIVAHFEKELDMPITETGVLNLMVKRSLGQL